MLRPANNAFTGAPAGAPAGAGGLAADAARRLTVFYHGDCPDGVAGAWAIFWALPPGVRDELAALGGVFAAGSGRADWNKQLAIGPVFVGAGHADPPPAAHLVEGRDVVYVDITAAADALVEVAGRARSLTVLDHHRSAQAAHARAAAAHPAKVAVVYDEERSGAQLGWDWAHAATAPGKAQQRPWFIEYVADHDLWRFELPGSREINKALQVGGYTRGFTYWSHFMRRRSASPPSELYVQGAAICEYEKGLVAQTAAQARLVAVYAQPPGEDAPREYCALAVNTAHLQSEVGAALMAGASPEVHFAAMWAYSHDRDEVWVRLRTTRPDVDLSSIAPHVVGAIAGGGHPQSAAFRVRGADVTVALQGRKALGGARGPTPPPATPPATPPLAGRKALGVQ